MHHGITRLQNEPHRRVRILELLDLPQNSVNDHRVLVLEGNAVVAPASVTIKNEREARNPARLLLGGQRRGGRGDGFDPLHVLRGPGSASTIRTTPTKKRLRSP